MDLLGVDTIERNRSALQALFDLSNELQMAIIDKLDKEFIKTLVEMAENVVTGRVTLTKDQLQKLHLYRTQLLELTQTNPLNPVKRNKELLQVGGLVDSVLEPVLAAKLPKGKTFFKEVKTSKRKRTGSSSR